MLTHALITPWPVSQGLRTWCGRDTRDADVRDDYVATAPEAVTCDRCTYAMSDAHVTLSTWAPKAWAAMTERYRLARDAGAP